MSSTPNKVRVMIVEDSNVAREFLRSLVDGDARFQVVAAVPSAEEALRVLKRAAPDVISMDVRLPGMNGFEATRCIMRERPTPIVVVSSGVDAKQMEILMHALRAGALSAVEKPVGMAHRDFALLAERFRSQLALMSQVKVVRQRDRRVSAAVADQPAGQTSRRPTPWRPPTEEFRLLGVVASTGGPNAVQSLLTGLGADFELPIVLVQHMADNFFDAFASWLDGISPLPVSLARHGEPALPGRVYVAPADRHLCVDDNALRLDLAEPVSNQRPSGTMLFRSMARTLGSRAIGVLLTGMGDDGAAGLKELFDAGAFTIAEDQSTAVVYGMPEVAVRSGAVCETLPLHQIAGRVKQLLAVGAEAAT